MGQFCLYSSQLNGMPGDLIRTALPGFPQLSAPMKLRLFLCFMGIYATLGFQTKCCVDRLSQSYYRTLPKMQLILPKRQFIDEGCAG
jgi:hypothetical protein